MSTPILEIRGLRKSYGALVVADAIDLSLAEGEAVGIIGPNGAGKSTLFNLIAGEVAADGGSIAFAGRGITRLGQPARTRLGLARSYQIPRPFADMSVYENVLVGAMFGAGGRIERPAVHCAQVLARIGLLDKANRLAGSLTLLERKRLELARALACQPRLLMLDEIAGGLTESEALDLVETIKAIHAGGTTILWIEHVLHALVSVVSRLVVLSFGKKLGDGAPQAVLASPEVREAYLGNEEAVA
ncbi:lipopolysaccharide export system ATP-binding protein LptB [mine drainage metagenome]|uniref:Lipopolysaccharide export system ATP-binding protein LptB n=1 Tax=mine drainage metagenome TaxID=410659 RepID=A0A1J5QQZ0_9ZZZZ